jgi:hypothetical protein
MKVLIAVNEFKGSLSSIEIGEVISSKINYKYNNVTSHVQPIADGGDGFLALFKGFDKMKFKTINAARQECEVNYLLDTKRKEAVIEIAEVIGLKHLNDTQKDPFITSTVGLGKLISFLIEIGIEHIIIGLGGSATNDCGIGMLSELGVKFTDRSGKPCKHGINELKNIYNIDHRFMNGRLKDIRFSIISDVSNPLIGKNGSTYIFAKQKGLDENKFAEVDKYIEKFSDKVQLVTGKNNVFSEGSGAAGGLGFAFMSFFNATIYPGSKFMIDYLNLESKIQEADIIITGEGKLDVQSYMGKAPIEIARIAKKFNKKVIFLAGSVIDDELSELNEDDRKLIDASFSIQRKFISLNTAMDKKVAKQNLENTIVQIFNILEFNHG